MSGFWNKLKKAAGVVLVAVILIAVAVLVSSAFVNKKENKPTFIFGYSFLWVETGSMEPALPERSCILVKAYGGEDLCVGDVITFICTDTSSAVYGGAVTHRIAQKTEGGYKTKGDNSSPDAWTVKPEDIVAVYVKNLPVLTFFYRIFASEFGLFLVLALFLGSCGFIYIPDLINAIKGEKCEKSEKEKQIEKLVQEEVLKMRERDKKGEE